MNYKAPRLGIDRFLALRWVDMAFELFLMHSEKSKARQQFRSWLIREIAGKESADKTASQISRIWLNDQDPFTNLRSMALSNDLADKREYWPILHYGLAINVFPLLADVCRASGRLLNLQSTCTSRDIYLRIQEKYGNPASVEQASRRTLQTLIDWGFLLNNDANLSMQIFSITDPLITEWLLIALMSAQSLDKIPLADAVRAPELLGIQLLDVRSAIRSTSHLSIERVLDIEMIAVTNDFSSLGDKQ